MYVCTWPYTWPYMYVHIANRFLYIYIYIDVHTAHISYLFIFKKKLFKQQRWWIMVKTSGISHLLGTNSLEFKCTRSNLEACRHSMATKMAGIRWRNDWQWNTHYFPSEYGKISFGNLLAIAGQHFTVVSWWFWHWSILRTLVMLDPRFLQL